MFPWAEHPGSATALVGLDEKPVSREELFRYSESIVGAMREAGVAPYSLVGIFLPRNADSAALVVAVLDGGFTGMSLDRRYTPPELSGACEAFPFRAMITQGAGVASLRKLFPAAACLPLPALGGEPLSLFLLDRESPSEFRANDVRWLLLTSGSTGKPKAVMISGKNLRERTHGEIRLFGLEPGDRVLNILSFAHDLGFNQLLTCVEAGATLALLPSFSPAELALRMARAPFAGLTATPTVWRNLLRARADGFEIPRAEPRYLTVSGGSATEAELAELRALFPKTRWILTYGQTETFRSLADGQPIPGVRIALRDGELIHSGEGTMTGYFGEASNEGSVATGDFFRIDERGRYHFVGRRDDMIKRDDHRFFPNEVESALLGIDCVADAAVLVRGEKLVAFVSLKDTVSDLRSLCRSRLMRHKMPDEFVVLERLPQMETGKIDRSELRRKAAECL